jgi:hypothetical protein
MKPRHFVKETVDNHRSLNCFVPPLDLPGPLTTYFKRESFFEAHFQLTLVPKTAIVAFFPRESVSRLFPRAGTSNSGIALLQLSA